jgi:hypothetical protein
MDVAAFTGTVAMVFMMISFEYLIGKTPYDL